MNSRRDFLRSSAGALAPWLRAAQPAADPWQEAAAIMQRIRPPKFPDREFPVTRFGAKPDGVTDCTAAFRQAIAECARAGGGRVVVPAGRFMTGAIHVQSGVNLHLTEGAVIVFTREPKAYLPAVYTRWEGMECMGYSAFLYAYRQDNIAITGRGTLDGQADCSHWWPWKGRTNCGWKKGEPNQEAARRRLIEMAERDAPVQERQFGDGSYLRPQFIQTYQCRNVLIEGVTIVNSPMWEIHPVLCRNVTVRNVDIRSHGPNNDGCNPESCHDVLIEGCRFDTGDDCIAIKSGRNRDGRRINVPSENIVIRGCQMKDGHGGVTIGSEMSGSVRNVFAEVCRMDSPNLDRALRIKTNAVRGGVVENVYLRKVHIGQVADAVIHVDFYYEEGARGDFLPVVRNIRVSDLTCEKSRYALYLRGFEKSPIANITLERCTFHRVESPNRLEHVQNLKFNEVKINGQPATA